MNKAEFQKKLVRLWMTTDGELTAKIIAKHTGAPAAELKMFLKELIGDGSITTSRNSDNQLTFVVPKKPRAAQVKKLRALKAAREAAAGGNTTEAANNTSLAKAKPPEADKKAAAAERKRRTKEAAESLEDEPLTAAEMEKLMSLTASVSADMEVKREQDAARKAREDEANAAQAAKQAALDAAEAARAAKEDGKKPKAKKGKEKKRSKKQEASGLDKVDMALALYEAMDNKPTVSDDQDDEDDKPRRAGWLTRIRRRFGAREAIEVASQARKELDQPKPPGEKSILFSGGISLILGPLGWNYAGSFREALPASVVWLGAAALVKSMSLFSFILMPAFFAGMAVSGIVGMVYAWQFNKKGKRIRLLGDGKKNANKELAE